MESQKENCQDYEEEICTKEKLCKLVMVHGKKMLYLNHRLMIVMKECNMTCYVKHHVNMTFLITGKINKSDHIKS